jgi:hypothetical protein
LPERFHLSSLASAYYARIHLPSQKYVWRSLKTSNAGIAFTLGRRLLFQMEQRDKQGLPPKSKKFSKVIDDYIRYRERDHAHGKTSAGMLRQIIRLAKFWREYAGELSVDAIDDRVMRVKPKSKVLLYTRIQKKYLRMLMQWFVRRSNVWVISRTLWLDRIA